MHLIGRANLSLINIISNQKKIAQKPILKNNDEISGICILEYLINIDIHFFKTYKCTKQNYLNKQFG